MAFYCIDYINGSDTTGNGTAAAPWKTIGYGQTQVTLAAGDEWRVHAGPAPTLLDTGAFQTAANSFTITTSTDLTGSLAANDYIFVQDFYAAFRIQTITSTTITLYNTIQVYPNYLGNGVTFNIWKAGGVPVNSTAAQLDTFATGTSTFGVNTDSIIVSGGWNNTFDAKTTFGRTFFYRTGNTNNNQSVGNIFRVVDTRGWVFKDFHFSGSGLLNFTVSTTAAVTNGAAKFENIVYCTWGGGSFFQQRNTTDDFYFTNSIAVSTALSSTSQISFSSSSWNPTAIVRLNNFTQVFKGKPNSGGFTCTRLSSLTPSFWKVELGNYTYINQAILSNWTVTDQLMPHMFLFNTMPTGDSYQNYFKLDSLSIPEETIQIFAPLSAQQMVRTYIELNSTTLAKIKYVGMTGYRLGQVTIKAPGSPFNTQSGMALSIDQDSIATTYCASLQPLKWIDTLNNREWYINGQSVSYIDTTNYVTGSNSIAVRPAGVGGGGNTYGCYIPAGISFYKKNSEQATITVKMKLLGPSTYTSQIRLAGGATGRLDAGYTNSGGWPTNVSVNLLVLNPNQDATTTEWRDAVYVVSPDTTLGPDMTQGYYFLIGEGENGSTLAEAGKYLLIDSVNITIS